MYLKNKIKVTVYIPCYNYGNYLSRAIESVLKQTFEDWELLIFDDNSEDNTQEVISKYKHFPSIRTFKTKRIGLCKIANLAIKESRGDFLIRLDADDIFNENILTKNMSSLQTPHGCRRLHLLCTSRYYWGIHC